MQMVCLAEVPRDGQRHLLAGQLGGPVGENPAEAERHHLGRATPDVDDHVHAPLERVDAAAHRARDRRVERHHRAEAGLFRRLQERAVLQRGGTRGNPDGRAAGESPSPPSRLVENRTQVRADRLQVGHHAVLHRADRQELGRRASEQVCRFRADGEDLLPAAVAPAQQQNGGFVVDDAVADVAHDGVAGSEIDAEVHRYVLLTPVVAPVWGCAGGRSMPGVAVRMGISRGGRSSLQRASRSGRHRGQSPGPAGAPARP